MPVISLDETNPFYETVVTMCKSVQFREKDILVDAKEYLDIKYPQREKEHYDNRPSARNESYFNY